MTDCSCTRTEIRCRTIRGGALQHIRQCLDCGFPVGSPLKQCGVVPAFDENLQDLVIEKREADRLAQRLKQKADWDIEYAAYLASPEWAAMRGRVLKRDDGLCQGCLDSPAEVVHHLTYAHVGCEFAFELVSLCGPCHTRCHEADEKA